jgi:hypothetical protein
MTDLYVTLVMMVLRKKEKTFFSVVQNSPFKKEKELFIGDAIKHWIHQGIAQLLLCIDRTLIFLSFVNHANSAS